MTSEIGAAGCGKHRVKVAFSVTLIVVIIGAVHLIDLWLILVFRFAILLQGYRERLYQALYSYINSKRGPHTCCACTECSSVLRAIIVQS
jgi:hypothetical protein